MDIPGSLGRSSPARDLKKQGQGAKQNPKGTQRGPRDIKKDPNVAKVDDFIAERGPRVLWRRVAQEREPAYIWDSLWADTVDDLTKKSRPRMLWQRVAPEQIPARRTARSD